MPSALPAYVEAVPDYEVRAGKMHIGLGGLDLVMPIDVFLTGCRLGEAAIAEWEASRGNEVVSFPVRFEQVYHPRV